MSHHHHHHGGGKKKARRGVISNESMSPGNVADLPKGDEKTEVRLLRACLLGDAWILLVCTRARLRASVRGLACVLACARA